MDYSPRLPSLLNDLAASSPAEKVPTALADGPESIEPQSTESKEDSGITGYAPIEPSVLDSGPAITLDPAGATPPPAPYADSHDQKAVTAVTAVTGDLDASSDRVRQRHWSVAFQVPGLESPMWMVSGPEEVAALMAQGVPAGTIWTVDELMPLLRDPGVTHEDAVKAALLRQVFNATIVESRVDNAPAPAAPAPLAPEVPEPVQGALDLDVPPPKEFD